MDWYGGDQIVEMIGIDKYDHYWDEDGNEVEVVEHTTFHPPKTERTVTIWIEDENGRGGNRTSEAGDGGPGS